MRRGIEDNLGSPHMLAEENIEELFSNLKPAPSHSLQHPTPKFEDIQHAHLYFDSDTAKEKFDALMRGVIAGNYVIDLGAVRRNHAYRFAWYFGAAGYIGIEASEEHTSDLRQAISQLPEQKDKPRARIFVGDLVDALKRLPSNCKNVVIFMAGIDQIIEYTGEHDDYIANLRFQLDRVEAKVITYASLSLPRSFKQIGGVKLPEGNFAIFEKPPTPAEQET